MANDKIIYTVEHSITGVIYVGACRNIFSRFFDHSTNPSEGMKAAIAQAEIEGADLRMRELDFGGPDLEAYWTQQMKAWGFSLININNMPRRPRKRKEKSALSLTAKPENNRA